MVGSADTLGPSPERFGWLFGPSDRPLDGSRLSESDFGDVSTFAFKHWQALPLIAPKIMNWGGAMFCKSSHASQLQDRWTSLYHFGRIQTRLCLRLVNAFQRARIRYVLLKGSAVRFSAYASPDQRVGKDIDIGVPPDRIDLAETLATDQGFVRAEWIANKKRFRRADPTLRAQVEARHYELGFLARRHAVTGLTAEDDAAIRRDLPTQYLWHEASDGRLCCYVSIDLHHAVSLDIGVTDMVKDARIVRHENQSLSIPSDAWLLFHLVFKLYWEGAHTYGKGGYQLADIAHVVRGMTAAEFGRFTKLLAAYRLEPAGYYVLRRLVSNLGMQVLPEIESFLDRLAVAPDEHDAMPVNDLGDMWPKLWGRR